MIEFVSYDGRYPNLCAGVLTLKIDGEIVEFERHSLVSGGGVWFDNEWSEHVESGAWMVEPEAIPQKYVHLIKEIKEVINENIPFGCCGGCV